MRPQDAQSGHYNRIHVNTDEHSGDYAKDRPRSHEPKIDGGRDYRKVQFTQTVRKQAEEY